MHQKLSKNKQAAVIAQKLGYVVLRDGSVRSHIGNILTPSMSGNGYLRFSVRYDKHYHVIVHQLVALQKFGDEYLHSDLQVRHLNGNPKDNSHDNIEIGTAKDDHADKDPATTQRVAELGGAARRRFSDKEVKEIFALRQQKLTYKQIADKFGCYKSTICDIINQKYYKKKKRDIQRGRVPSSEGSGL